MTPTLLPAVGVLGCADSAVAAIGLAVPAGVAVLRAAFETSCGVRVAVGALVGASATESAGARIATGTMPEFAGAARLSRSAASAACGFGGGISGSELRSQAP